MKNPFKAIAEKFNSLSLKFHSKKHRKDGQFSKALVDGLGDGFFGVGAMILITGVVFPPAAPVAVAGGSFLVAGGLTKYAASRMKVSTAERSADNSPPPLLKPEPPHALYTCSG